MSRNFGLNYLYRKIFKEKSSIEADEFIKNLSWSFLGGLITSIVMFAVNIYIGRIIGPYQFGKYNLVLTISQLLLVPIMFGFEVSSVRAISKSIDSQERKDIISTTFLFVIANMAIFSILIFLFTPLITKKFDFENRIIYIALLFTIIVATKQLLDSFIRGLQQFYNQFLGRILELIIALIAFGLLIFYFKKLDYLSYIIILSCGAISLILYYLIYLKIYFSRFNLFVFKEVFAYGKFILLGSVLGTAFNSLDKIIIAKYLSITQLGIYSAYYIASTNLVAQLIQIFINVFFPTVSKSVSKNLILKIDKLSKTLIVPGTVFFSCLIFLIMKIFGKQYGINYSYVLSFGFLAVMQFIYSTYSYLIMAISEKLYKKFLVVLNVVNGIHIIGYGVLIYIDKVSIQTIIILFLINTIINIIMQRRILYNNTLWQ